MAWTMKLVTGNEISSLEDEFVSLEEDDGSFA